MVERSGRLAGGICARMLSDLGCDVSCVSVSGDALPDEPASWRRHPFTAEGKHHINMDSDASGFAAEWRRRVARADIIVVTAASDEAGRSSIDDIAPEIDLKTTILCALSTYGLDAHEVPYDNPNETELQALSGLMATTGSLSGAPAAVDTPVLELFTGLNAATSILAALRVMEAGGGGQLLDVAAFDSSFALLGTFLGDVMNGKVRGFRGGCRHPIIAPWNAYRTSDGWVIVCSSTDQQWEDLLRLMNKAERIGDPRFVNPQSRVTHVDIVDSLINEWMATKTTAEAVERLEQAAIPIGPAVSVAELMRRGNPIPCRRSRAKPSASAVQRGDGPKDIPNPPCKGIRVIEVGPFTAGPLTGRLLSNLGAEVIKVEPPGGEVSRNWSPQFNGASGYFANYNAGKRSVTLDLRSTKDHETFVSLVKSSDVLLHNLKAGAMERMSLGPEEMHDAHPGLVYCAISGYGRAGPATPALDTVIQAKAGLMSLIHSGDGPIKAGFSIADLVAAHIAPMEIIAALRHRQRTGKGQFLDISMFDSVSWLTRLSWPDSDGRLPESRVVEAADGWILARCEDCDLHRLLEVTEIEKLGCAELLGEFAKHDIPAIKILELDEVFDLEIVKRRHLIREAADGRGTKTRLIAAPFGLTATPPRYDGVVVDAGCDNLALTKH